MNGKMTIIFTFLSVFCILALCSPDTANAQVSGIRGVPIGNASSMPKVEINRETILTLRLWRELIGILPAGINKLGQRYGEGEWRLGSSTQGKYAIDGGASIQYEVKVLQLDRDGMTLGATATKASGAILTSQILSLKNYEEAIMEIAKAVGEDKRLVIRFLPTIEAIPPVLDYQTLAYSRADQEGHPLLQVLFNRVRRVCCSSGPQA